MGVPEEDVLGKQDGRVVGAGLPNYDVRFGVRIGRVRCRGPAVRGLRTTEVSAHDVIVLKVKES